MIIYCKIAYFQTFFFQLPVADPFLEKVNLSDLGELLFKYLYLMFPDKFLRPSCCKLFLLFWVKYWNLSIISDKFEWLLDCWLIQVGLKSQLLIFLSCFTCFIHQNFWFTWFFKNLLQPKEFYQKFIMQKFKSVIKIFLFVKSQNQNKKLSKVTAVMPKRSKKAYLTEFSTRKSNEFRFDFFIENFLFIENYK